MEQALSSIALLPHLIEFHNQSVEPAPKMVSIPLGEFMQLKREGPYWKAHWQSATDSNAILKQVIIEKDALIRDLQQRLFGKKSEKGKGGSQKATESEPEIVNKLPRGQQKGSRGHGRTLRPDLPVIEEKHELSGDSCSCPGCGLPYKPFPGDEESDIVEINVKAYCRHIRRERYKKSCTCPNTPVIIVAPPPPKVIPKSPYGISVWVYILLGKFLYSQPLQRILRDLRGYGLSISSGSMTGGLQKIVALLLPLQQAFYEHQMTESRFHNDESRWEVFADCEGKIGHRWYLWVTKSPQVVYYQIAPTRSASVPLAHYSELEAEEAIIVCDRYSAYKKLARLMAAIVLAFCWAHVRRDFLDIANGFPTLKEWALTWVDEIGALYHLNRQRLSHWQKALPLSEQSALFYQAQKLLEEKLEQMKERFTLLLQADQIARSSSQTTVKPSTSKKASKTSKLRNPDSERVSLLVPGELHWAQRYVLNSLKNHWQGLIIFLTHPEVPMDNNNGERVIRNPVTGRKNYYGSGSVWSSELAAMSFTQFQTIELWGLNPRHWLEEYLTACAINGGVAPSDLTPFLPWCMSEERLKELAKPSTTSQNTS
jgi:transposase